MRLSVLAQAVEFKPYHLEVTIKFAAIKHALGMSGLVEGPLFSTYVFTAISQGLLAHSHQPEFSTRLFISAAIPGDQPLYKTAMNLQRKPVALLRRARGGSEFGIRANSEWMEAFGEKVEPLLNNVENWDGSVFIRLCFLPEGYIPEHVSRYSQPLGLIRTFDRDQRRWKTQLNKEGWQIDEDEP